MTIEGIITLLSEHKIYVSAYLSFIPLFSLFLRLLHGKYRGKWTPWKYFYSVIIYLSCVPGIFSLVISAYSMLFLQVNMLTLDIFVYYLPILSMVLTLIIVRKSVSFDQIPGFEKINGLIILLILTFIIVIFLERLRVFVFFGGTALSLLIAFIAVFLLLKYGIRLIFGVKKRRF